MSSDTTEEAAAELSCTLEEKWAEMIEHCPAGALTIIASAFDPDYLWDNMARQCGWARTDALRIRAYIGRTFNGDGTRRPMLAESNSRVQSSILLDP